MAKLILHFVPFKIIHFLSTDNHCTVRHVLEVLVSDIKNCFYEKKFFLKIENENLSWWECETVEVQQFVSSYREGLVLLQPSSRSSRSVSVIRMLRRFGSPPNGWIEGSPCESESAGEERGVPSFGKGGIGRGGPSLAPASLSDASSSDSSLMWFEMASCIAFKLWPVWFPTRVATLRNHTMKHHGEQGVPSLQVASV